MRPSWVQVLTGLQEEYARTAEKNRELWTSLRRLARVHALMAAGDVAMVTTLAGTGAAGAS